MKMVGSRPLAAFAIVLAVAGCGSSSADDPPGKKIATGNGCASCHGSNGQGQVAPAFVGLFGSEVTLEDGSVVIADDAYLRAAITDPNSQVVEGYSLPMPSNNLSDEQVDQIVDWIKSLADTEP